MKGLGGVHGDEREHSGYDKDDPDTRTKFRKCGKTILLIVIVDSLFRYFHLAGLYLRTYYLVNFVYQ